MRRVVPVWATANRLSGLGAGPLSRDARHAALTADLPVYLRQSHAEADLAGLGELARERDPAW